MASQCSRGGQSSEETDCVCRADTGTDSGAEPAAESSRDDADVLQAGRGDLSPECGEAVSSSQNCEEEDVPQPLLSGNSEELDSASALHASVQLGPLRVNMPIQSSSARSGRSSAKPDIPRPQIKSNTPVLEQSFPFKPSPSATPPKSPVYIVTGSRSPSTSPYRLPKNWIPLSAKRTSSLPLSSHFSASTSDGDSVDEDTSSDMLLRKGSGIIRSQSVPVSELASFKKGASQTGGLVLVIAAARSAEAGEGITPADTVQAGGDIVEGEEKSEEIPEDDAVCRICMVELNEGGETLKMECHCKGELALAHRECAIKWFSMKGNHTCEVCGQAVKNLPVTLLRVGNDRNGNRRSQQEDLRRVWQDVPVLVMISMLAYFCFLEQLLVMDMGSSALVIALPFACVLGLLASVTASTLGKGPVTASALVSKRYVWMYAAFQFALVILFAHLFYSLIHVEAVLSILLASFAGFGIAMSLNAIFLEYINWRQRRQGGGGSSNSETPPGERGAVPEASTTTVGMPHQRQQHDIENQVADGRRES